MYHWPYMTIAEENFTYIIFVIFKIVYKYKNIITVSFWMNLLTIKLKVNYIIYACTLGFLQYLNFKARLSRVFLNFNILHRYS